MEEHHASPWLFVANAGFVALLLVLASLAGTRRMERIPRRFWQNVAEQTVESFRYFAVNVIGPGGEKHAPFLGTLFLFILTSNLIGLVPVFSKAAPTANLNTTIALALVTFLYVQWQGIRANGFLGYLKHFTMGTHPALWVLMVPLEIIGELAKPLSLAVRLYGNMYGKEQVIIVLVGLAASLLPIWLPIPFQFPILVFGVFVGFVQALVFTLLAGIYINLMTQHEHEEEHA
ncbi:MAG: F0F1 ATP synthase subunit A, partial [Armatimonadota bacterium]|nr:F0F1 ATP synthase subunit A [Armatimonadota bacterium]